MIKNQNTNKNQSSANNEEKGSLQSLLEVEGQIHQFLYNQP